MRNVIRRMAGLLAAKRAGLVRALVVAGTVLAAAASTRADTIDNPLGFWSFTTYPFIGSYDITATYDGAKFSATSSGSVGTVWFDESNSSEIANQSLDISASFAPGVSSPGFASSSLTGSLEIKGDIAGYTTGTETLISGYLHAIGFTLGSPILQFSFHAESGVVAGLFRSSPYGPDAGVTLSLVTEFLGWDTYANAADHTMSSYAVAETRPVPLPSAIWLLGSGVSALAALRRRFGKC